jgi:hypothetical protein
LVKSGAFSRSSWAILLTNHSGKKVAVMDSKGFRSYLQKRKMAKDDIERAVGIVERFEAFLTRSGRPGSLTQALREDVNAFSAQLIEEKLNAYDNYVALARYGQFVNNNALYIAVVEYLDGHEALKNLHSKLAKEIGAARRDEIFKDVRLPPLGTPSTQKPRLTQTVVERLERAVGVESCRRILGSGLRTLPDEGYLQAKKKYEEAGTLDAYLEQKGKDFIRELEKIKREGGLYFTQEITDEVIAFVRSRPEIMQGVRKGNVVYEVKIPYMTKQYLAETDEKMRRYYYCHCPWVRESLRTGDADVPGVFCNCSAAFHKKPWEVIFGRSLEAEVVETVLDGGRWCKFAIYLPDDNRLRT